ncbi:MAG TPA: hypothetical protein VGN88_01285, partial [Phycisphaerae bacterium]
PINLDLGGATLISATAQPICKTTDGDTTYYFFAQTPGVPSNFEFGKNTTIDTASGQITHNDQGTSVRDVKNVAPSIQLHAADGKKQMIYLVDDKTALGIWKGTLAGKPHVFLSDYSLSFDASSITTAFSGSTLANFAALPPLTAPTTSDNVLLPGQVVAGIQHINFSAADITKHTAIVESLKPAGTLRTISMGSQKVAAEPTDADFDNAAQWKITLPANVPADSKLLLRLHYTGDVARIYLGDKLILDDFYHGQPLDIPLWRLSSTLDPHMQGGQQVPIIASLTVKILPLQKGAPIYFAKWPTFEGPSIAKIDSAELIEQHQIILTTK